MLAILRAVAVCMAAGAVLPSAAAAATVGNVLPQGGLEAGARGWVPEGATRLRRTRETAKDGHWSLEVVASGRGSAGVSVVAPSDVLRTRGLLSPITGALRGSYEASAWVKGKGNAVGKPLQLQLNEFGGATAEAVLGNAAASIRLGRHWRRVSVHGSPRRPDRTGAAAVFVLDDPGKNETFFVDRARLGGDPLGNVAVTHRARWHWWQYAAVWAVVLAGGAAWLVRGRRGKTARLRAS